jgi:hypothetical protein
MDEEQEYIIPVKTIKEKTWIPIYINYQTFYRSPKKDVNGYYWYMTNYDYQLPQLVGVSSKSDGKDFEYLGQRYGFTDFYSYGIKTSRLLGYYDSIQEYIRDKEKFIQDKIEKGYPDIDIFERNKLVNELTNIYKDKKYNWNYIFKRFN